MWLQHDIASAYRNPLLLKFNKSILKELLGPKINTGTFHAYHVAPRAPCVVSFTSCHPVPLLRVPPPLVIISVLHYWQVSYPY